MSGTSEASRCVLLAECPLCGGADPRPLVMAEPDGFEWVRCGCGLVYKRSSRAADATAIAQHDANAVYDSDYFARYARRRRRRIAKSRRQIRDALEAAAPGPLLDVGCSLGYALEAAQSLGLAASGVDVSAHAAERCRSLGFDAREGTLDALPFADGSFSVALLKHVFEHTPRPREALRELRRVLVAGGAAFFAVPDIGYFKAARSPETSRFFRGEAGRAHFVYYSPATLARMLETEGFSVASVHPRLSHRRARPALRALELAALPLRVPFRTAAEALGLRKEFWLVAVRT